MKKFCLVCTICVLIATWLCIPVSAECQILLPASDTSGANTESQLDWQEAQDFAYLDPENASPEMREKILSARNTIIFSTDWVADGFEMRVEDRDGNVIQRLPHFSELFPGWDLPVYDMELEQADEAIEIQYEEEAAPKIFPTAFTEKSTYPQQCIRK